MRSARKNSRSNEPAAAAAGAADDDDDGRAPDEPVKLSLIPPSTVEPKDRALLDEARIPIAFVVSHAADALRVRRMIMRALWFLPLLVLFIIYAYYRVDWTQRYFSGRVLNENFIEGQVPPTLWHVGATPNEYNYPLTFHDIINVTEWHAWLEGVVVPPYFVRSQPLVANTKRGPFGSLQTVGAIRLSQYRVRNNSCELPSASVIYSSAANTSKSCYAKFADSNLEKQPIVDSTGIAAAAWAGTPYALGSVFTIPWVATCPGATSSVVGVVADYPCGGNVLDLPIMGVSFNVTLARLRALRSINYFDDRSVRMVVVELFVYNPALDDFTGLRALVEVNAGGSLVVSSVMSNFAAYAGGYNGNAYFVVDVIFTFFVIAHLAVFAASTISALRQSIRLSISAFNGVVHVVMEFGFLLDLALYLLMLASVGINFQWMLASAEYVLRERNAAVDVFSVSSQVYRAGFPIELRAVRDLKFSQQQVDGFVSILIFFKLCTFVSLHPTMNVLMKALGRAVSGLFAVVALFFVMSTAYALSGVQLFGHMVFEYRNVNSALSTQIQSLMGKFNYESLRLVNRTMTFFYFWSYIIIALFVLLNFFAAITSLAYNTEHEVSVTLSLDTTAMRFIRRMGTISFSNFIIMIVRWVTFRRPLRDELFLKHLEAFRRSRWRQAGLLEEDVLAGVEDEPPVTMTRTLLMEEVFPASDRDDNVLSTEYIDSRFLDMAEDFDAFTQRHRHTEEGKMEVEVRAGAMKGFADGIDKLAPLVHSAVGAVMFGVETTVVAKDAVGGSAAAGVAGCPKPWGGIAPQFEHAASETDLVQNYLDREFGVLAEVDGASGVRARAQDIASTARLYRRLLKFRVGANNATTLS